MGDEHEKDSNQAFPVYQLSEQNLSRWGGEAIHETNFYYMLGENEFKTRAILVNCVEEGNHNQKPYIDDAEKANDASMIFQ